MPNDLWMNTTIPQGFGEIYFSPSFYLLAVSFTEKTRALLLSSSQFGTLSLDFTGLSSPPAETTAVATIAIFSLAFHTAA